VRQLEQAVLAAFTICETDEIQPKDFPAWFHNAVGGYNDQTMPYQPVTDERSDEKMPGERRVKFGVEERMRYLETLDLTKYDGTGRWNFSAAARRLGVPRKTFMYRLKRMQII
jgi:DNA-binding NtrC family response regulator